MAMTLRTDEELDAALTELAELEHVSKQEVIRRAVLARADQIGHEARVRESSERMLAKWGNVLDRLGSV
jgi:predicted transcriptional regulator